ncbi:CGNR zinc finger domain-containing protein [Actinokineospora alba]|uniref:CGNR zinc finger domain-containing protein n=1 Tax=Actinokineospora alba TaxID=504798 RepID=A0A1H0FRI9_9PSEU|nr:CGNR zinc finger domain-containing protein [Actinokineospora alba]TDP69587.1 CGNR zinc finger protein [Actinokineospora alba]SDI13575.1 CGNR zinc finger domain-containing protein [Actinokineospora alba]SDN97308.1 CGNR zinc finger domain-containing protein [Actinokineospora alba]
MTWTATSRYGLDVAPDGLALVHDFLNTASADWPRKPDLLADRALATEWIGSALATWASQWGAPVLDEVDLDTLSERDLAVLRRARAGLLESLCSRDFGTGGSAGGGDGDALAGLANLEVAVEAGFGLDGIVHFKPKGRGWRMLLGPVALEMRRAQDAGVWARLKTCKNERCRGAFYDRSRNNSGVWHDVRTCGNVANLRASRERRRQAAEQAVGRQARTR